MSLKSLQAFDSTHTDLILMCKNTMVYNVSTETVMNEQLLPGYMNELPCNHTFKEWMKFRYSSLSNSLARKLRGITFGQGNRLRMNIETGAFSLSDCYCLKKKYSGKQFEQVSPYFADFWKGIGEWRGEAIPSLYVGGALDKYWDNKGDLIKIGKNVEQEILAVQLCKAAGISCNAITKTKEGICVKNFTNPDQMLEQADASGRFDSEDFTDDDIVEIFGEKGMEMLVVDAITANTDRHAGNFGFLRDSNTGEYLGMAPLYDFDQVLQSKHPNDVLVQDLLQTVQQFPMYKERAINIAETAVTSNLHPVFSERAKVLLNALQE